LQATAASPVREVGNAAGGRNDRPHCGDPDFVRRRPTPLYRFCPWIPRRTLVHVTEAIDRITLDEAFGFLALVVTVVLVVLIAIDRFRSR
jgi:hypothetical protein